MLRKKFRMQQINILRLICFMILVILIPSIRAQIVENVTPVLQVGHTGEISASVMTVDSRLIVTGGAEGTIKYWNRMTGMLDLTIKAHTGSVNALTLSPDGKFVASAGDDRIIRLWNLQTGQLEKSYQGHTTSVSSIAFSPDGNFIASGGGTFSDAGDISDNTVRLWDRNTGRLLKAYSDHKGQVLEVAFSNKGDYIVSGSLDKSIKVWSVLRDISPITINTNAFHSITFSPDDKTIASADYEQVIFWDSRSGQKRHSIQHKTYSTKAVFTSDWRLMFIGQSSIQVWDVESQQLVKSLDTENRSILSASPDGLYIVVGGHKGRVAVWDVNRNVINRDFEEKSYSPHYTTGVTFNKKGDKLAWVGEGVGDEDSYGDSIYIWDRQNGSLKIPIEGNRYDEVNEVAFSPNDKLLISCADSEIKVLSAENGNFIRNINYRTSSTILCESVAFSPDGKLLAVGGVTYQKKRNSKGELETDYESETASIDLVDFNSGRLIRTFIIPNPSSNNSLGIFRKISFKKRGGPGFVVHSVAFSPDGRLLASGDDFNHVRLWDVISGKSLNILRGHTGGINSVAFSSDGKKLASGSFDNTVKIWDVKSGSTLKTLIGHSNRVTSVKFSPDNQIVISGSVDQTVRLWDANTGSQKSSFEEHRGAVTFVAISHDGKSIASSSFDGLINIWSVNDKALLSSIYVSLNGKWINFTPDGFYTGSNEAAKYLAWRKDNKTYDTEVFAQALLKPDTVMARVRGLIPPVTPKKPVVTSDTNTGEIIKINEAEKSFRQKWKEHRFLALIIGNQDYKHLEKLETSLKDATVIEQILKEKYKFEVQMLPNAKRKDIIDALQFYETLADENTSLLIYYTGHGEFVNDPNSNYRKAYWQPIDADSVNRANWISSDQIIESLNLIKAKHILVVSDSCFSGGLAKKSYSNTLSGEPIDELMRVMERKSRTLISSGGLEPVDDEGEDGHSVFGGLFIKALKEMPANQFTANKLYIEYIYTNVPKRARQTPEINYIHNTGDDNGRFIFIRQ